VKRYATVSWTVDDVMILAKAKGLKITRRKAKEFLSHVAIVIRMRMTERGWKAMRTLMNRHKDNLAGKEKACP